jgi:hypothetical protein
MARRTPSKPGQGPVDPTRQDAYEGDLHPAAHAGQNHGETALDAANVKPASSIKALRNRLSGFERAELHEILVLLEGSRLQQGATYLDLDEPFPEPFTATGGMVVEKGQVLVCKSDTPYALWNRLIGLTEPERTI